MGYTKILRQAKYTAADKEKALNYIYSETKRLELLSHRLLELMELSANRIELQKIDAYELLQEALQLAEERLMIKIHCKAEHAYVLGEHELLISCIMNLLENAKKRVIRKYILHSAVKQSQAAIKLRSVITASEWHKAN